LSPDDWSDAARPLFAMGRPVAGTLAEIYLRERGITALINLPALRFHPRCKYLPDDGDPSGTRDAWPALLAAVTDGDGTVTGVQRTWLDSPGRTKAPVATPRWAMGHLLGNAVRSETAEPAPGKAGVLAAGEGIDPRPLPEERTVSAPRAARGMAAMRCVAMT